MKTRLGTGVLVVVLGVLGLGAAPIDLGREPAPGSPLDAIEQLNSAGFLEEDRAKELAGTVAVKDLPEAAQRALRLRDEGIRKAMLCAVVGCWGAKNPVPAAQFVEAIANEALQVELIAGLYEFWPLADVAAAANRAKGYAEGSRSKREALCQLTKRVGPTEPKQALELLLGAGKPESRMEAIKILFDLWACKDLVAAKAAADKLEDLGDRFWASWPVGEVWVRRDAEAAMQWVSGLPPNIRARLFGFTLSGLAGQDPAKAAAYAPNLPASETHFAGVIARRWAAKDPAAAKAWVLAMPAGGFRSVALNHLVAELTVHDVGGAAAFAVALTNSAERLSSVRLLALWWAQPEGSLSANGIAEPALNGLDDAITWVKGLKDEADRYSAFYGLALVWMKKAPADMLNYCTTLPATKERDELITIQAGYWSELDRPQAVEWVFEQTNPAIAGKCLGQLLYFSKGKDVKELGTRVAKLPAGEVKNAMVAPTYRSWKKQDAAAAQQWLDGLDLPAELKEQIVNPPKKPKKK